MMILSILLLKKGYEILKAKKFIIYVAYLGIINLTPCVWQEQRALRVHFPGDVLVAPRGRRQTEFPGFFSAPFKVW